MTTNTDTVLTPEQIRELAIEAGCDPERDDGAIVMRLARAVERAVLQSQDRDDAADFGAVRRIPDGALDSLKHRAWALMDKTTQRGRHVQVEANTLLDLVAMAKAHNHARRIEGET